MSTKDPIKLKAEVRAKIGSRYAKRSRESGKLPGVVYGHKQDPVAIDLPAVDANRHFAAGEKVFLLDFPGTKNQDEGQMVLLKALQFDYLGTNIVHADFARVDAKERVRTKVHVELKGDAKGLKSAGAILIHPVNEVEIECRVLDIPDSLIVDVTDLGLDEQITVGQVKLPLADMKMITDVHAIVAQIVEQKEVVTAEAATVEGAAAVAPEVIGEKERAEKAAAKDAGAKPGAAKAAAPAAKK
jgi:large subunit ribosomal protein L25